MSEPGSAAPVPLDERIRRVERKLADATARLPRHSVPAAMLIEIEDLEQELERLRQERDAA